MNGNNNDPGMFLAFIVLPLLTWFALGLIWVERNWPPEQLARKQPAQNAPHRTQAAEDAQRDEQEELARCIRNADEAAAAENPPAVGSIVWSDFYLWRREGPVKGGTKGPLWVLRVYRRGAENRAHGLRVVDATGAQHDLSFVNVDWDMTLGRTVEVGK